MNNLPEQQLLFYVGIMVAIFLSKYYDWVLKRKTNQRKKNQMKQNIGYLYLIITCVIWGSIYVVSKYALAALGPVTVLCFRFVVSVLCMLALLHVRGSRRPIDKGDWKYLWILGGLGYFMSIICQLLGTKLLDASLASLLNAINPVSISIMAAVFLKERIQPKHVAGIAISLAGIYIILGTGGEGINLAGVVISVVSVIFWSMASVAVRKIAGKYDPVQLSLYGMLIALIFTVPSAILEAAMVQPPAFELQAMLACVYLGVIGTAVAHTLWNMSLQLLDASVCSMFYPLQPLTSAVMGVLVFHEVMTMNFIAGGIMICLGVIVSVVEWKRKS